MNYKETVERQISGDADELMRRKELWGEIVDAYNNGGEDGVKSVLTAHAGKITNEFKDLLNQLERSL